jgi:DNA end-binding protein Ku
MASSDFSSTYMLGVRLVAFPSRPGTRVPGVDETSRVPRKELVPKSGIDPRYLIRPYYLVPDGKVGHDAFAVIRETIRNMDMVAIGRVVLTSREHIIGLEPLENGLMGTLLRYPYEVRDEKEYFEEIQDVKVGNAQLADKLAYLRRYSWPANTAPRLPPPVRSKPRTVPFNHGLRLHDRQGA